MQSSNLFNIIKGGKKSYFRSIKNKVICLDFAIVVPLFILFCILMMYALRENNYNLNYSKLELLEEKCTNIGNRNTEVVKITNGLYLDSDINRILSKKQLLSGYEYIEAEDEIQSKMLELTEMFPDRQYQLMLLCNSGNSYFQSSLQFSKDELNYDDISSENWFHEMEENDKIYFLPKYRSEALQELFQDDTLFAVRTVRNLNSGRPIGVMIVAIAENIWGNDILNRTDSDENTMVIDEYRKIIFSSDEELYGTDVENNSYYEQIKKYSKGFFLGNVNGEYCHIRFADIKDTGWKMISYDPYKSGWSFYTILILVLGIGMLIAIVAIVFYNCNFISRRMKRLNKNILEVSKGNLKARVQDDYETEFQEICMNFNTMLDHIENLMRQLEKEEEEKHSLEIQALQAQINPHFFHNTLVTIRFMIQMEQYQDADRAILAFSKLLRKSFANSHRIIPLKEEVSMVEEYLELMLLRYPEGFQWNITIGEDVKNLGILKNVLQPLVENSISHGFNMKQGTGHIKIRAYRFHDTLIIEVEDDGVGVDLEKINDCIQKQQELKDRNQLSSIGLSNIQMRIVRNFGKEYGLTVAVNPSGGVTFTMRLPLVNLGEE